MHGPLGRNLEGLESSVAGRTLPPAHLIPTVSKLPLLKPHPTSSEAPSLPSAEGGPGWAGWPATLLQQQSTPPEGGPWKERKDVGVPGRGEEGVWRPWRHVLPLTEARRVESGVSVAGRGAEVWESQASCLHRGPLGPERLSKPSSLGPCTPGSQFTH